MVHSSVLCSAVTAHGNFWTQFGKYLTRPCVSQTIKRHLQRPVFCADDYERNTILGAIEDYHQRTTIRFKPYEPWADSDYIHITGDDSGCWSYVGRIGGVSNTVQGVVKTSPALRNATPGFCSFIHQHTNPHRFITCYNHPYEQLTNRPVRTAVTNSRTSCWFTNHQMRGADNWTGNFVQQISVCLRKSVWYRQVIMVLCNNMFLLHCWLYSA
jgi:hypothetical protein